jgi:hypothetical protein
MPTLLWEIAEKAKRLPRHRFGNLYRLLNEELLKDSWPYLRKDAALGVDQVSAAAYEQNLDENIQRLVERLKAKKYRARLVRRHYIPKGEGKWRPPGDLSGGRQTVADCRDANPDRDLRGGFSSL